MAFTPNTTYANFSPAKHFGLLRGPQSNGKTVGAACVALAWMSVFLNVYVVVSLLVHRKQALKNVFYLLVLHCAFVDFLRATSLIVFFLPDIDLFPIGAVAYFHITKAKQMLLVALRSLNMLTILNLLVFTVNEFVVVKKPLQYRRMVRRRMVLTLLLFSWLLSFMFGTGSVLKHNYSPPEVMVRLRAAVEENSTLQNTTHNQQGSSHANNVSANIRQHLTRQRRFETDESLHYAFIIVVVVVCASCLVTVLTCYIQIMRRIRKFHKCDFRTMSSDSVRIRGSISSRGSNNASGNNFGASGNNGGGSCSGMSGSGGDRKRRVRVQVIIRHKYLLVIGLVLLVDILFLVPYSVIQIMQYVHISASPVSGSAGDDATNGTTVNATSFFAPGSKLAAWPEARWVLQLLIALHSVLQPMCYFRMEDFRRLAACQKMQQRDMSVRAATMVPAKTSLDADLAAYTEDDEEIMMSIMANNNSSSTSVPLRHMDSRALLKNKLRTRRSCESSSSHSVTLLTRL